MDKFIHTPIGMITIDTLIKRCQALSEASGLSLPTISRKLFGDGSRLPALMRGKDMGARRLEGALPELERLERDYARGNSAQESSQCTSSSSSRNCEQSQAGAA